MADCKAPGFPRPAILNAWTRAPSKAFPIEPHSASREGIQPMHRRIRSRAALALFAFATMKLWNDTSLAQVDCASVNMTVTATVSNDPGFVGLYKYTVSGSWDVGRRALSHLDVFLALENCVCVCDPRVFKFPATAGTSNGGTQSGTLCTVSYV